MMNFPLQKQTIGIGEQQVSLFVPDATAIKSAYENGRISFPYWSKIWPAAIALSEFILHQPQYIKGKTVLELGAGLGLPSLVAAPYASHVLCTDSSQDAVDTVAKSAEHLQLRNLDTVVLDWKSLSKDLNADVLLLSDVNYELNAFYTLTKTINSFLQNGTVVLLSTPQRLMAKTFVEPLLPFCIYKEDYNVKQTEDSTVVSVIALAQKKK